MLSLGGINQYYKKRDDQYLGQNNVFGRNQNFEPTQQRPVNFAENNEVVKAGNASFNNNFSIMDIVTGGLKTNANEDKQQFGEHTTVTSPNSVKGIDNPKRISSNPFTSSNSGISSQQNPFGVTREFTDSLSRFDYNQPVVDRKHIWNA